MEPEINSAGETPAEGDNPLPVAESVPAEPVIESVAPVEPLPIQNKVAGQPAQQQTTEEKQPAPRPPQEPLLVRVVEDDELSAFEKKTIRYGKAGIAVAFLALVAACVTAYFIYQQFSEMNYANTLAEIAAKRARYDSRDSSIATAKQLAIMGRQLSALQDQLTQQGAALEIDQRPWLKFELGGERPKDADPNNGKDRLLTTTAGQPIKVETRVTNIGKTTAERIIGTLIVQYVTKGQKPVVTPRKGKNIRFTAGCPLTRRSAAGMMWLEATLYPSEVSQKSFSRARCGKNGVVEDDPITQSEKAEIDRHNAYVMIAGEVWYSDVFGVRHWTRFCEMSDPQLDLSVARGCIEFGTVDGNQGREGSHHNPN